jgi:hypothetical protein
VTRALNADRTPKVAPGKDREARLERKFAASAEARVKLSSRVSAIIRGKAMARSKSEGAPLAPTPNLPAVLRAEDGRAIPPEDLQRLLRRHFQKTDAAAEPTPADTEAYVAALYNHLVDIALQFTGPVGQPISMSELIDTLLRLKAGKAPGHDGIMVDLLMWLPLSGKELLLKLYNACLTQGVVPKDWMLGIISPLLKAGREEFLLSSYRPITLLSALWKTLERIVLNRLSAIIKPRIADEQGWGFPGRGAEEQLFTLSEAIEQSPSPVFAVFLDIREAFDSVWTEQLLNGLATMGADLHSWRLIRSWYEGYQARVKLAKGLLSAPFQIRVGTRQGSVLSPLLFNILINQLTTRLKASGLGLSLLGRRLPCLLFGDDVVLLAASIPDLQALTDIAADFATNSKLRFAENKCKAMQLGPRHELPPEDDISLRQARLPWVNSYEYLGLPFASGPDIFGPAVLTRCAIAAAACRDFMTLSAGKVTRPSPVERRDLFVTIVAASRDFGLHAVRLPPRLEAALRANDALCEQILRLELRGPDRLSCRVAARRRALAARLRKAPTWSWRTGLLPSSHLSAVA